MLRKVIKAFIDSIDTKKFLSIFRLIIMLFLLLFFLNLGDFALSRYESNVNVGISPKLAFFIVNIGTYNDSFEMGKLLPSSEPYIYTFSISNFKDSRRINVNLEYEIEIVTTTNLPLNFKVFKSNSDMLGAGIVSTDTIITDVNGMYFRKMVINEVFTFSYTKNQTNNYTLWVEFPESYKHYSESYEGVLDLIEIKVNARQVV